MRAPLITLFGDAEREISLSPLSTALSFLVHNILVLILYVSRRVRVKSCISCAQSCIVLAFASRARMNYFISAVLTIVDIMFFLIMRNAPFGEKFVCSDART